MRNSQLFDQRKKEIYKLLNSPHKDEGDPPVDAPQGVEQSGGKYDKLRSKANSS